jgi:hypothetical protein
MEDYQEIKHLCFMVLNKERFLSVKKVYLKEIIEIELDEYSRID